MAFGLATLHCRPVCCLARPSVAYLGSRRALVTAMSLYCVYVAYKILLKEGIAGIGKQYSYLDPKLSLARKNMEAQEEVSASLMTH